jgi:hypothetical protein
MVSRSFGSQVRAGVDSVSSRLAATPCRLRPTTRSWRDRGPIRQQLVEQRSDLLTRQPQHPRPLVSVCEPILPGQERQPYAAAPISEGSNWTAARPASRPSWRVIRAEVRGGVGTGSRVRAHAPAGTCPSRPCLVAGGAPRGHAASAGIHRPRVHFLERLLQRARRWASASTRPLWHQFQRARHYRETRPE